MTPVQEVDGWDPLLGSSEDYSLICEIDLAGLPAGVSDCAAKGGSLVAVPMRSVATRRRRKWHTQDLLHLREGQLGLVPLLLLKPAPEVAVLPCMTLHVILVLVLTVVLIQQRGTGWRLPHRRRKARYWHGGWAGPQREHARRKALGTSVDVVVRPRVWVLCDKVSIDLELAVCQEVVPLPLAVERVPRAVRHAGV